MQRNNTRLVLLAPSSNEIHPRLNSVEVSRDLHSHFLQGLQQLRGKIYLGDGAIKPWQLDENGCFKTPTDDKSWHCLLVDDENHVVGGASYCRYASTVSARVLRTTHAALGQDEQWRMKVNAALTNELHFARQNGLSFVELGGWAIQEEYRCTNAMLQILLASYAWAELTGHAICACTATCRHGSASILRRMGGESLFAGGEALPPYYDPAYDCEMEMLRFDSRQPNPRFVPHLKALTEQLANCQVVKQGQPMSIAAASGRTERSFPYGLPLPIPAQAAMAHATS